MVNKINQLNRFQRISHSDLDDIILIQAAEGLVKYLPDDLSYFMRRWLAVVQDKPKDKTGEKPEMRQTIRITRRDFSMFGVSEQRMRHSLLPERARKRNIALLKVMGDCEKQLKIRHYALVCSNADVSTADMPYRIFSWRLEDSLQRRDIYDFVYIDVLLLKYSATCLQRLKFKFDIEELCDIQEVIMNALINDGRDTEFNVDLEILQILDEMEDYLRYEEQLKKELAKNKQILLQLFESEVSAGRKYFDVKKMAHLRMIKLTLSSSDALLPLEYRFQMRWYNQYSHGEYTDDKKLKELEDGTAFNQTNQNVDSDASASTLHCYFMEVEDIQNRLLFFNRQYEADFERLNNEIMIKRLKITKLKERQAFLKEQIKRFHQEMDDYRQMEWEAEQKQLELIRQQEAAKLARMSKAKKPKK